jgi:hypothetical protein
MDVVTAGGGSGLDQVHPAPSDFGQQIVPWPQNQMPVDESFLEEMRPYGITQCRPLLKKDVSATADLELAVLRHQ